ncbi:hypothetical protein HK096_010159, partial [Nowakowskiella sp. JEL0078]
NGFTGSPLTSYTDAYGKESDSMIMVYRVTLPNFNQPSLPISPTNSSTSTSLTSSATTTSTATTTTTTTDIPTTTTTTSTTTDIPTTTTTTSTTTHIPTTTATTTTTTDIPTTTTTKTTTTDIPTTTTTTTTKTTTTITTTTTTTKISTTATTSIPLTTTSMTTSPTKITTTSTTLTSPTASPNLLGEWQFCSVSSQCANKCCSNQYSNDGKLKCTPFGTKCVIGTTTKASSTTTTKASITTTTTSTTQTLLDSWSFCSVSSQCANKCCSKQYSGDGKLKCTPFGTICVTGTTLTSRTTTKTLKPIPTLLADWEFCSSSSDCLDKCCSKQYSNDGRYKCTPGGTKSK